MIAGPKVLTTTTDRLAGLRRAAREHGRSLPPRRVVYTDFNRDGGAEAAAALLDADPGLTAIVALNDSMAVGALAALRERGIDVPGEVSVIGFDDMPIARDMTPPLTTVRLPLVEMGDARDDAGPGHGGAHHPVGRARGRHHRHPRQHRLTPLTPALRPREQSRAIAVNSALCAHRGR